VSAYQVAGHPTPPIGSTSPCHACPGIGSCGGMFTYNTMQTFIGVVGMQPLHMVAPRPTIRAASTNSPPSWSIIWRP